MTAARYYKLTYFLPDVINQKKKASTLPDWPEIKIFYFDPSCMDTSVREFLPALKVMVPLYYTMPNYS